VFVLLSAVDPFLTDGVEVEGPLGAVYEKD
jgi:hypothetical protein